MSQRKIPYDPYMRKFLKSSEGLWIIVRRLKDYAVPGVLTSPLCLGIPNFSLKSVCIYPIIFISCSSASFILS